MSSTFWYEFGWPGLSFSVWEMKISCVHFLRNFVVDLDENQYVATTCSCLEGHANFISASKTQEMEPCWYDFVNLLGVQHCPVSWHLRTNLFKTCCDVSINRSLRWCGCRVYSTLVEWITCNSCGTVKLSWVGGLKSDEMRVRLIGLHVCWLAWCTLSLSDCWCCQHSHQQSGLLSFCVGFL